MHRNQAGRSWIIKLFLFAGAAMISGIASGATLAVVGGLLPSPVRVGLATLLGTAAVACGLFEGSGSQIRPLQCDRETPQAWIHRGPLKWAIWNGVALGNGAFTRIGFCVWYVVPLAALLSARPTVGIAIYGTYGLVRGIAPLVLIVSARRRSFMVVSDWLLLRAPLARLCASAQLLVVGTVIAIDVGM